MLPGAGGGGGGGRVQQRGTKNFTGMETVCVLAVTVMTQV